MGFLEQKPSQTTDDRLTVSVWEATSVGLSRRNQMEVLRKRARTMIRQFLFRCDGLTGTHSADFFVYFVLKRP